MFSFTCQLDMIGKKGMGIMAEIKVVGTTYENREEIIQQIVDSHYAKGNSLKGIARLEKEPTNPHDPNAIKVLFKDTKGKWFHVGYVPREETGEVVQLMKKVSRFDVSEHLASYTLHPVDIVKATENNPFVKEGDGSTKTKILNRIGCGLMVFILLMIILIIFS